MRIFAVLSVFLFAVHAQAACDLTFLMHNLCANLEWKVGPQVTKESQLVVRFTNYRTGVSEAPTDPLTVVLAMHMKGAGGKEHGHGTKPTKVESTTNLGEYTVKNMYFLMPGTWQATFSLGNEAIKILFKL